MESNLSPEIDRKCLRRLSMTLLLNNADIIIDSWEGVILPIYSGYDAP